MTLYILLTDLKRQFRNIKTFLFTVLAVQVYTDLKNHTKEHNTKNYVCVSELPMQLSNGQIDLNEMLVCTCAHVVCACEHVSVCGYKQVKLQVAASLTHVPVVRALPRARAWSA